MKEENNDVDNRNFYEKLTFNSAPLNKRFIAFLIDVVICIIIWFLVTSLFFKGIDQFIEILGKDESDFSSFDKLSELRELLTELYLNLIVSWVFIRGIYYTLVPAIIGNGRTIGKYFTNIGVVDKKTLNELSPTRLVLREFVFRCFFEITFIIPYIVSLFMCFFREDSKSVHDIFAKSVVIELDLYEMDHVDL